MQDFSHGVIQSGGGGQGPGARGGDIGSHNIVNSTINNYGSNSGDQLAYLSEKLRPVSGAGIMEDKACIEGTRAGTLKLLSDWIDDPTGPNVLFLVGGAGTGKSAIANRIGVLRRDRLGSFFSFNRTYQSMRHPASILRTIAYNLATWNVDFRSALESIVREQHSLTNFESDITSQWHYLLVQPTNNALSDIGNTLLVIDALDESGTRASRQLLLSFLTQHSGRLPPNFRILVTSRPEADVTEVLTKHFVRIMQIDLDSKKEEAVQDVDVYLRYRFSNAGLRIPRSANADYEKLVKQADGLFQWAFTISEWMLGSDMEGMTWRERYKSLFTTITTSGDFPLGPLDLLYSTILGRAFPSKNQHIRKRFCSVMAQMLCAAEPLSIDALTSMRNCSLPQGNESDSDGEDASEEIMLIMKHLGSLLRGTAAADVPVQPYHTSFRDFLLDKNRAGEWHVNVADGHSVMIYGCFWVMNKDLHFNLCDFPSSFGSNNDMLHILQQSSAISQPLKYACQYWTVHLEGTLDSELCQLIEVWTQEKLLFWFEAMSILGLVSKAASALASLENVVGNPDKKQLSAFLQDAQKFIKFFAFPVAESMPHIYISALPFAAKSSLVARHYRQEYQNTISLDHGVLANWPAQQALLAGDSGLVASVAFSPDGGYIASGSDDKTIRIWDAATGQPFGQLLEGHSDGVTSVAFSPDGRYIASGSDDKTVRIWDTATGQPFGQPLEGHSDGITSVVFSPDGKYIASGSSDETVRMWDTVTGQPFGQPLEGHSDKVTSVAFSPDGRYIASGSNDETVKMWDAATGQPFGQPLEGHFDGVISIAFSPDGRYIASGSYDRTVRMWVAATGQPFGQPLEGHSNWVRSVSFSPDGRYIASGSDDRTIRIWDAATGQPFGQPLEGHSDEVTSVVFSPDGRYIASGSDDKTVRMWDAVATGQLLGQPLEGHSDEITSIVFSPDGKYIASGSGDETVRMWDTVTGQPFGQPLEGHSDKVLSVAFSPDGRYIASGSIDQTVRMWDAATGQPFGEPLEGHSHWVLSVAFSSDGKYIASGSENKTVRMWDAATGQPFGQPLKDHSLRVTSVVFSPDGRFFASGSENKTVRIWDAVTGQPFGQPIKGHADGVTSVAFSPDGGYIASGSYDKTVRMWDVVTGQPFGQPLEGHSDWVVSVAFSPDGRYIASGSTDKTVRIWDAATGQPFGQPLEGHSNTVTSVAFSPDGIYIASGSEDKTIRIWEMPVNLDTGHIRTTNLPKHYFFSADVFLKANGWVCGPNGRLLLWIPPDNRPGLHLHGAIRVIPTQLETILDCSSVVWGPDWATCYTPDGKPMDTLSREQGEEEDHSTDMEDNSEEISHMARFDKEDDGYRSSGSGDSDSFKSCKSSWDEE